MWEYTPYTVFSLAAAVLSGALAVYTARRKGVPGAAMASLFMVGVCVWSAASAVELSAAGSLARHVFWSQVSYVGIVLVPYTWVLFAMQYTGREEWANRRNAALLAVMPAITLALVFTNGLHGLIWSRTTLDDSGPFVGLAVEYGPMFVAWVSYGYVLLAVGAVLVVSMLARSGDLYGRQGMVLLFGVAAPWLGNALYIAGLVPIPNYDPTPFFLLLTGIAMALGISRYGILDVVPVARAAVVEEMEDGVIVFDAHGRVLDANPAAQGVCKVPASEAVGLHLGEVVSSPALLREIEDWQGPSDGSTVGVASRHARVSEPADGAAQGESDDAADGKAGGAGRRDFEVTLSTFRRGRREARFVVVREVTERVQRALLFTLMVENALDIVAIFDPDGSLRYISPSIERGLGYGRKEVMGMKSAFEVIHPEDAEVALGYFARVRATPGINPPVSFRVRHKDGSWRHMEMICNNLMHDPEVGGVVASWRDVSARVAAEGEVRRLNAMLERRIVARTAELEQTLRDLAESEERYRALFENAVEGVFQTAADGRLTHANPAMARTFGYPDPRTLISSLDGPVAGLYADSGEAREVARLLREEGEISAMEARTVRPDGSEAWISVSARTVLDDGGEILRYEGTVQDITERVEARRTLEKRVSALTRLAENLTAEQPLESALTAVAETLTRDTSATAASLALVDETTGELQLVVSHGLPEGYDAALYDAWNGDASGLIRETSLSGRQHFIPEGRRTVLETPGFAPLHPVLARADWQGVCQTPLASRGVVLGVINTHYPPGEEPPEDEKAFLRAVGDQAAVAVENFRYVGRFFAIGRAQAATEERQRISRELHDSVSQALYGIALGARTARTLLDRDPPRAAEPMEYVLSLAEAGLAEMRALIFELRPEALEAEGLVAALEKQAAALRARHEVAVSFDPPPEPPMSPQAKEALYRIAQEALQNTIKHARASSVGIRLETTDGAAPAVSLEIGDDGAGFDPTADFPGHLGLSSMRERAEGLGGTLHIESAPGKGARVRARVPLR